MAGSKLITSALLVGMALLSACSTKQVEEQSMNDSVSMMADLHCEAVTLRKARFELADRMRFMQDTIMLTGTTDSAKAVLEATLADLEPYKDSIVKRSLDLSKVIKANLDSLIEHKFMEPNEREAFDSLLTSELAKRACQ
ncbi:MAG: hypothetical protein K9J17_04935 [Flavobacteriales bacterium]|nr:hypothetical protein [Flavobacteriales bacterium]